MRILIDIGHPAHVHLFRNFALQMMQKGHKILFTCREKEFEIELLNSFGLEYINFGKHYKGKLLKLFGLIKFNMLMIKTIIRFNPTCLLSHGSPYAAQAAWLLGKTHISFEDTFNFEQVRLYLPFTKTVLTCDYAHPLKSQKCIRYAGYHELAYLHPNIFKPDQSIKSKLGLSGIEKLVIVRFVSWEATHDKGHSGISLNNKIKSINGLSKYARVFISSESPLPAELAQYKFPLEPHEMHSAIASASLIFGESATMVSEGAVLGVPGIYLDNTSRFYTQEQEQKYGLVFNYSESKEDQLLAIEKAIELIQLDSDYWQSNRNKLLSDKIDLTAFLVWFVENYPQSFTIMKENPDYQLRFR